MQIVFITYDMRTAIANPVAPNPLSTKISDVRIMDNAQTKFNNRLPHILFLLYIDISIRFDADENIVDIARYINGCLSVKSLPYIFIIDSPKKRINKYLEKTIFVTPEKMNVTFCMVNGVLVTYNKLFETNLLVTYLLY